MTSAQYRPEVFNAGNTQSAKNIILTPETGQTTDERWEKETPYVVDLLSPHLSITYRSPGMGIFWVLDFGCGIGRLSRELLLKSQPTMVVGLDISTNMRALAIAYVNHAGFTTMAAEMLQRTDLRFHFAISVWSLQHVFEPQKEIDMIFDRLYNYGRLFIINEKIRVVPTDQGWVDDGIDLYEILVKRFGQPIAEGKLDPEMTSQHMADRTYWAVFQKTL